VNINLTLIGRSDCLRYFRLVLASSMYGRQLRQPWKRARRKLADGLSAADRASLDLELAQERAAQQMRQAKDEAAGLIDQANKRAAQIVEASKGDARKEGEKLIEQAHAEIQQERVQARDALRADVAALAIAGAEKILESAVDAKAHAKC